MIKRLAVTVPAPFTMSTTSERSVPRADIERLTDIAARAIVVCLFSMMAMRFGVDFVKTGRGTGLLLLVSELLVVVLTVMRRSAAAVDRSMHARVLTGVSMLGPSLLKPASVLALMPQIVTVAGLKSCSVAL